MRYGTKDHVPHLPPAALDRNPVWGLTPYRFPTTIRTVRPDHGTSGSYTVELTTRQWQIIDATMDNEVSVEAQNGDPRGVVDSGHQVRVAGWDQVACRTPGVPGQGAGRRTDRSSRSRCPASSGLWLIAGMTGHEPRLDDVGAPRRRGGGVTSPP
jgi:hypothetical protein